MTHRIGAGIHVRPIRVSERSGRWITPWHRVYRHAWLDWQVRTPSNIGTRPGYVAYHEAGHVVIAIRLGITVYRATIVANQHRAGIAVFDGASNEPWAHWRRACVAFAGYCAAVESGQDPDDARRHAGTDFDDARDTKVGEADGIATTFELVRKPENWHAIETVATELDKHSTLDDTELETLVQIADGAATLEDLQRYRAFRVASL